MLIIPVPEAAATSTVADPPIEAETVGTNANPTVGVKPIGSPTACHWARVAVPRDTITTGVPAVVEVRGVPDKGLMLALLPVSVRV